MSAELHVKAVPTEKKVDNLKLTLELGRISVIYADETFTVYITIKNISDVPVYMWNFGIMGCSEFYFQKVWKTTGSIEGRPPQKFAEKLKNFIFYLSSLRTRVKKAYTDYKKHLEESPQDAPELTEDEVKQKAKLDYLKGFHYKRIRKGGNTPKELVPGEEFTANIMGKTQKSLFFRPDKYKLTLFADYSKDNVFFRETKIESVDILASISSIMVGAAIGGGLATFLTIFQTSQDIFTLRSLFEIAGAAILSILAVVALARKTGVQTLVTIQDFWGGVLVGFLIGYSGKSFFEKIIGVS